MIQDSSPTSINKPPPPPLPPQSALNVSLLNKHNSSIHHENELNVILQQITNSSENVDSIVFKKFLPVNEVLQEGPTCGMVALSMALKGENVIYKELTRVAVQKKWSRNGEIFSCEWMCKLVEAVTDKFFPLHLKDGIFSHLQEICDTVIKEGCVLVPYDKDKDHRPCLKKGTAAHWAVVSGLVLFQVTKQSENEEKTSVWNLRGFPGIDVFLDKGQLKFKESCGTREVAELYVCAFQGCSRHVQLWSLQKLAESNANLKIVDGKRAGEVLLPPGGIDAGLCGQIVLLMPKTIDSG